MNLENASPPPPLAYRVPEVARLLSMGVRTVWRLISEGKLVAHRDHGTKIPAESVRAYLENFGKSKS